MGKRARPSKDSNSARLADFSRGSYISHRAIENLLCKARKEGIPEAISRTSQWRARKELVQKLTPYGSLIQTMDLLLDDGPKQIAAQNPFALLYIACKECQPFAKLMHDSLILHPCSPESPWNLIIYHDEVGFSPLKADS